MSTCCDSTGCCAPASDAKAPGQTMTLETVTVQTKAQTCECDCDCTCVDGTCEPGCC